MFNLQDYETVDERLHKWWEKYPDGRVETELIEASNTRYIVSAKLYKTEANAKACATGLASETITEKGVNSTSALENCETSAIGRALANAGFAAKGKRSSREEMAKVNEYEKRLEQRRYGNPGSKSAAVEDALRASFEVDNKQDDPQLWNVEKVVDDIGKSQPLPEFDCGKMKLKEGVAKNGKPYYGYVCDCGKHPDNQCKPKWARQTAAGNWYFEGGE
jgi:hypothetical protein